MDISPLFTGLYTPPVLVSEPQLTGSDYRYKWLSRSQQLTKTEAISVLSAYVPHSSSSPSLPTIISSRLKAVLEEIAEGRRENVKQIVITDSESLAYALARYLHKEGIRMIELYAVAGAKSPQAFLATKQVACFNAASPAVLGLVCLPSFIQTSPSLPLSSIPVVSRIIVAEKPITPTSQTLYHNLLLSLSTPINQHAQIIEIFSETESRLQLQTPRSETCSEKMESCLKILNGLMKRDKKQFVCEILEEMEWNAMEEYHQNHDFLFPSNESRCVNQNSFKPSPLSPTPRILSLMKN